MSLSPPPHPLAAKSVWVRASAPYLHRCINVFLRAAGPQRVPRKRRLHEAHELLHLWGEEEGREEGREEEGLAGTTKLPTPLLSSRHEFPPHCCR